MKVSVQLNWQHSSEFRHVWLPITQELQNDYRLQSTLSQVSRQELCNT